MIFLAALLLLAVLFLVRPGANQLRTRIVSTISLAVGRPVDVASVNLRFLPQPGFDLEGFIMRDDPSFGAEPMIRAQEVTAFLRVSSLLRGHVEVARLAFSEPSLNLVRNGTGHWNLEKLLQRASEIPVAPTDKAKSEPRSSFPYIEASDARINFKVEHEKLPYALTGADFSLWQDSENTWGMRLEAQPFRTDLNLSDTGNVKISGSWQRATNLRDTPLKINLQWEDAQLGQLTKLIYGDDKGWRGAVLLSTGLNGTPADLSIVAQTSVHDFRRYDIVGGGPMRLGAQCKAHYSSVDRLLSQIDCNAPVGEGELSLAGSIAGISERGAYDLSVSARAVPVQSVAALLRHAKDDIPRDLLAAGKIDGSAKLSHEASGNGVPVWQGQGEVVDFRLASKSTKAELSLERIRFGLLKPGQGHGAAVEIGPLAIAMGRPTPVAVRASLARAGYSVQVQGDAQVRRLLQSAQALGVPVPRFSADGPVKLDLVIAGEWKGFPAPTITGKAQLHGVRADVAEFTQPLEISSATVALSPERTRITNLTASLAGSTWRGSMDVPRPCNRESKCSIRFSLAADTVDATQLGKASGLSSRNGMWYRFLPSSGKPAPTFLNTVHASGKIAAERLVIQQVSATHLSADAVLEDGVLQLSNLQAELMGSVHHGVWTADFIKRPPVFTGSGTFDELNLEQLSAAMHDGWITGSAGASYEVKASGGAVASLLSSATGSLTVEAREGSLPHLIISGGPLEFQRFTGKFLLNAGKLEISDGKLQTSDTTYQLAGSAALSNELDFRLIRNTGRGFNVTGSLTSPRVEPALFPETQAALKP